VSHVLDIQTQTVSGGHRMCRYCCRATSPSRAKQELEGPLPCSAVLEHLRRLALFRERDPWFAEEVAVLVYNDLVEAVLRGRPPMHPPAWISRVMAVKLYRLKRRSNPRPVSLDHLVDTYGDEVEQRARRPLECRTLRIPGEQSIAQLVALLESIFTSYEVQVLRAIPGSLTIAESARRCQSTPPRLASGNATHYLKDTPQAPEVRWRLRSRW